MFSHKTQVNIKQISCGLGTKLFKLNKLNFDCECASSIYLFVAGILMKEINLLGLSNIVLFQFHERICVNICNVGFKEVFI